MALANDPEKGLDIVELVDHDPGWRSLFEREKGSLAETLGPVAISVDHVGSTAVPGIRAKPVIDILVTTTDLCLEKVEGGLAKLGYVHVPIGNPERLFFRKGMPRTHHLHVVRHGGEEHMKHIRFRDRLIAHPEEAQEYVRLKGSLARRFREDREAYSNGKDDFIAMILARSDDEGGRNI